MEGIELEGIGSDEHGCDAPPVAASDDGDLRPLGDPIDVGGGAAAGRGHVRSRRGEGESDDVDGAEGKGKEER